MEAEQGKVELELANARKKDRKKRQAGNNEKRKSGLSSSKNSHNKTKRKSNHESCEKESGRSSKPDPPRDDGVALAQAARKKREEERARRILESASEGQNNSPREAESMAPIALEKATVVSIPIHLSSLTTPSSPSRQPRTMKNYSPSPTSSSTSSPTLGTLSPLIGASNPQKHKLGSSQSCSSVSALHSSQIEERPNSARSARSPKTLENTSWSSQANFAGMFTMRSKADAQELVSATKQFLSISVDVAAEFSKSRAQTISGLLLSTKTIGRLIGDFVDMCESEEDRVPAQVAVMTFSQNVEAMKLILKKYAKAEVENK